jgi:hypothetical protein
VLARQVARAGGRHHGVRGEGPEPHRGELGVAHLEGDGFRHEISLSSPPSSRALIFASSVAVNSLSKATGHGAFIEVRLVAEGTSAPRFELLRA